MEKYIYSDEELAFMEKSPIPFAVYQFINKRVVTIVLSEGFIELFGYADMDKKDVYDLMDSNMYRDAHPDDLAVLGDEAYRFATEGSAYDVMYRTKRNDEYRIIHSYGKHITKENGTRLAFIWYTDQGPFVDDGKIENDSILNSLKNKLAERSFGIKTVHDPLTGLPAMSYFFELADAYCKEMRRNGKTPAIIYTDFNGMKIYNQKYGLAEGDKVLKGFANEITNIFSHDNCSRLSADHYCIYTDEETARSSAPKIIEANQKNEIERKISLRIGIYLYEDETVSISGACDRAKIACDSGRNNFSANIYYFDSKMMTAIEDKQYVVGNVDRAIKEGWVKAFYQPIVRTANGRVCHEEALARWIDPQKGMLSPAAFIPALEESNNIYKLDLYILELVLEKMKEQAKSGLYIVPISVNLSRSDFYTCDIVEEIRKRVDLTDIPREKIVIEITESIVASDVDYMIDKIKQFKELGFSVWMDDFGSGYSSPVILQKVPFDLIKIDMLFVRQLEESENAKVVLTEIIRMAMSLGLDTVAEGIETKEQADFLNDIGCTMLQGYYFCKPIPLDEILDRNKKGIQIGFENPDESGYYAQLGKVNIYNLSMTNVEDDSLKDYFDTWPMVMLEYKDDIISIVKANTTFKNYVKYLYHRPFEKKDLEVTKYLNMHGATTIKEVIACARTGNRVIFEDTTMEGKKIQILAWRIAVNPITNVAAVMLAVLSSTKTSSEGEEDKKAKELDEMNDKYIKLLQENAELKAEAEANHRVTEIKKALANYMTNMPAMIFSKDVKTGKYLSCNKAFEDFIHKDGPDKIIGLTDFDLFDHETAENYIMHDKKALAMEDPYILYEDAVDSEGNNRRFQTTKLKYTDDLGRECLLGFCQDVTNVANVMKEKLT